MCDVKQSDVSEVLSVSREGVGRRGGAIVGEGGVCCMCPVDHFKVIQYKGRPTATGPMKELFRWIYGWHEIEDGVPKYCKFAEEHDADEPGD